MNKLTGPFQFLEMEAMSLLDRVQNLRPFALHMPMVGAALSTHTLATLDAHINKMRQRLAKMIADYIQWLRGVDPSEHSAVQAHRQYSFLRLHFNDVLGQFDLFSDVVTQRAEHEHGIWLAGLDVVATDALSLSREHYLTPPVMTYLDRGLGAAIRRIRTRLPGDAKNPVAIIRIPRERMVGSGVASSLVHEVGHQGSVLLDLINSFRPVLQSLQKGMGDLKRAWRMWERWISEIIADFWAVAKIGVGATLGLMSVLSLPRPFIFRINNFDPHPIPWIRVKLSCTMGFMLYPHPQWGRLEKIWETYYPIKRLSVKQKSVLAPLERSLTSFVSLLIHHRPKALKGKTLQSVLANPNRHPNKLREMWERGISIEQLCLYPPVLVLGMLGQARADGKLSSLAEGELLRKLFERWALRNIQ